MDYTNHNTTLRTNLLHYKTPQEVFLYCYELSEIEKGIDALATVIENNKPIEQIPKKYMIN